MYNNSTDVNVHPGEIAETLLERLCAQQILHLLLFGFWDFWGGEIDCFEWMKLIELGITGTWFIISFVSFILLIRSSVK